MMPVSRTLSMAILFTLALVPTLEACRVIAPTPRRMPRATATRTPRPSFTPRRAMELATATATPQLPTEIPTIVPPTEPAPSEMPTAPIATTARATLEPTPLPTQTESATTPALAPQPPREGGSWDFESGFFAHASGFEGRVDTVGVEWNYFRQRGEHGQPTFNENKNLANVRRGERSQEIAFESSDGAAGILRTIDVIPNHRYSVSAWAIHYPSPSPIELDMGIDLTGEVNSRADTVQWFPWNEQGAGKWLYTQVTMMATSDKMTLFIRGTHRVAASGGATLFDDVRVEDLGE